MNFWEYCILGERGGDSIQCLVWIFRAASQLVPLRFVSTHIALERREWWSCPLNTGWLTPGMLRLPVFNISRRTLIVSLYLTIWLLPKLCQHTQNSGEKRLMDLPSQYRSSPLSNISYVALKICTLHILIFGTLDNFTLARILTGILYNVAHYTCPV